MEELGLADPWFATKTNSAVDPPADQSSPGPCPQNWTLLSQVPALKPHISGEASTLNLHSQNLSPSTSFIVLSFSINLFVSLYLHVVSTNKRYVWFLQPVVWNRLRTWRPAADHSGPGLIDHCSGSSFINRAHPSASPGSHWRGKRKRREPGRNVTRRSERWRGWRRDTRGLGPNTADQTKGEPTPQDGPTLGKSDGGSTWTDYTHLILGTELTAVL